jgi:hypothetical protein
MISILYRPKHQGDEIWVNERAVRAYSHEPLAGELAGTVLIATNEILQRTTEHFNPMASGHVLHQDVV